MKRQDYENDYDKPDVIKDTCSSNSYDYSIFSTNKPKQCVDPEICYYKYRVDDCIKVVYINKKDYKFAKTIYQKLTEEEDASRKFDLNKFPIHGHEGNWIPMQIYDYDDNLVRDYNKGKVIGRNSNGSLIYDGFSSSVPTTYSDIFGIKKGLGSEGNKSGGRKSRWRKSRWRKSRGRKSRGRKSRGRKSRGRKKSRGERRVGEKE